MGVALLDKNLIGKTISNTKVVADKDSVAMYACKEMGR